MNCTSLQFTVEISSIFLINEDILKNKLLSFEFCRFNSQPKHEHPSFYKLRRKVFLRILFIELYNRFIVFKLLKEPYNLTEE